MWERTNTLLQMSNSCCLKCSVSSYATQLFISSLSFSSVDGQKWLSWKCWAVVQFSWRWFVDLDPHTYFKSCYSPFTCVLTFIILETDPRHDFFQTSYVLSVLKLLASWSHHKNTSLVPYIHVWACATKLSVNLALPKRCTEHCNTSYDSCIAWNLPLAMEYNGYYSRCLSVPYNR